MTRKCAKTAKMQKIGTDTFTTNPSYDIRIVCDLVQAVLSESTCDPSFTLTDGEIIKGMEESILNDIVVAKAKRTNQNFGQSRLMSKFRCNPSMFISLLLAEHDTTISTLLRGWKEKLRVNCLSAEDMALCVSLIRLLMESQLTSVRFASICFTMYLIHEFRTYRSFMNSLMILVDSTLNRLRDTSELVRKLVGFNLVLSFGSDMGFSSDDLVCSTVEGLLADPSRSIRLRMLQVLTKEFRKTNDESRLAILADRLGPSVVRRCFDKEESIATVAIQLLSDVKHGEAFLKDYDKAFDDLSNLVWHIKCDGNSLPLQPRQGAKCDLFQISREAIVFVNNHIMASSDLLGKGLTGSGIATVVEFILQYSDGHIPIPTFNFMSTLKSYFAAYKKPFYVDSFILAGYMEKQIQEALLDQPSLSQRITSCGRLGVCLHIVLAVLRLCYPDEFGIGGIPAMVDLIRDLVFCESLVRVYESTTEQYPGLNILATIDDIALNLVKLPECGPGMDPFPTGDQVGSEERRKRFWSDFSASLQR